MDPATLNANFIQAVLYYCGVTNSDPNRYRGYDPSGLSPDIGTTDYTQPDLLTYVNSWNPSLSYPIPSNETLAIPTLEQVTTFYNEAYAFPSQIMNNQPFAKLAYADIQSMETADLTQDSIVTDTTNHRNLHLSGSTWVQSVATNLTGVVTSVGAVTTIPNGNITNNMLANSAVANLSGTNTGDQSVAAANGFGAASGSSLTLSVTPTGLLAGSSGQIIAASSGDVTAKLLVGFNPTVGGSLLATDSILHALEKVQINLTGAPFLPLAGGTLTGPVDGVTSLTSASGGQLVLNNASNRVDLGATSDFRWSDMAIVVGKRAGTKTVSYSASQVKSVGLDSFTSSETNHFTLDSSTGIFTYTGTPTKKVKVTYTFGVTPGTALTAGTIQHFININNESSAVPSTALPTDTAWPSLALVSQNLIPVYVRDIITLHTNDTVSLGGSLIAGLAQLVVYWDVGVTIEALPL